MVKSEKELLKFYKEYIDIPLFRVVPNCDYNKILKEGINPKKDPYKNIKHLILQFEKIVRKLEEKGFIMFLKWGHQEVSGAYALGVTLVDLSIGYVDFAPDEDAVPYYLALRGGAATSNLKRIIKRIRENKIELSKNDNEAIKKIEVWTNKRNCENKAFYVKGTSKSFETALFQIRRKPKPQKRRKLKGHPDYLESLFGSFENFKKVAAKHGLKKYSYYLRNKLFFLRVKDKIPKEEIISLKNNKAPRYNNDSVPPSKD